MRETRTALVLLGSAAIVASLFAPWFAIELGGPAREAIDAQTGQLPGVLGEFARGLLSVLPERIVANGWQVFERADVVLLCCALAAAFAALLRRLDVAALAGGAAGVTTLVAMLDRPGPGGDVVRMQWGPWLALAGAVVIVVAARMGSGRLAPAPPSVDWSTPASPAPQPPGSVAPPGG